MAWLVVGDFNQIMTSDERHDGNLRNLRLAQRMADSLHSRGLLELNASGPKFTWSNRQFDGNLLMKKLDRATANMPWRIFFTEGVVKVLPKTRSDHNPILSGLKLHG